ncbi:hypothetical protein LMG9585_21845, partial [Xanthomonas oryzae pv. oryzae]
MQGVEFLFVLGTLCQQPLCALQPDTDALTHRRFQLGQLALQIASYASQDRALASQYLAHALELARM